MQVKNFYAFFCLIAEICLKESFCPPQKKSHFLPIAYMLSANISIALSFDSFS